MQQDFDVKNYKLLQEISAGGVAVMEKDGKTMVVTIEREKTHDHSLPKGHQGQGESLQETAIREVLEETGYKAEPESYLGVFTYNVKSESNKTISMRTVHWFLMEVIGGKLREPNEEVHEVKVIPIDGDFSFLTYDNDRMFIERAREKLEKLQQKEFYTLPGVPASFIELKNTE